jgi:hypothetical protein
MPSAIAAKRGQGCRPQSETQCRCRTTSFHNLRTYCRERIVGDFAGNGAPSPVQYKVREI